MTPTGFPSVSDMYWIELSVDMVKALYQSMKVAMFIGFGRLQSAGSSVLAVAARFNEYIGGPVQYRQMPEFDFPALVITAPDVPATPVAPGALHGAARMDVNLAIASDFHALDFDPFNIKRDCDILGHGTPRFKIALPGLATICLH